MAVHDPCAVAIGKLKRPAKQQELGQAPVTCDRSLDVTLSPRRVKQEAERRKRESKQKVVAEKKRVAVVKDGVGEFETHTKGVASRMMEKMG